MDQDIYQKTVEDSFQNLKKSLLDDVSSNDFPWDLLIEMLIIENSPLASVFSIRTLQLSELYNTAKHLSTVAHDIDNHDNQVVDEDVSEKITKTEAKENQGGQEDYADFEDV